MLTTSESTTYNRKGISKNETNVVNSVGENAQEKTKKTINNTTDCITTSLGELRNPIEPITNQLSVFLKKEIDFKTSKKSKNHSRDFYFRIGKFVISKTVG